MTNTCEHRTGINSSHLPTGKRVNGSRIAQSILNQLKPRCQRLKFHGITPTLAVILVGRDSASLSYIKQKRKVGDKIGTHIHLYQFSQKGQKQTIVEVIKKLNQDPLIHGIIIQLPLSAQFDADSMIITIEPKKDVDGFLPNSPFTPPVACAVLTILKHIYQNTVLARERGKLRNWLKAQNIAIVGRGPTGGKPIADTFNKMGISFNVIHSQTKNPKKILKKSSIVISAVGKRRVIKPSDIKKGAIVIGVGLHREKKPLPRSTLKKSLEQLPLKNSVLVSDYDEKEIGQKAAFYTPTPGGVGPVNVACLWKNVIKAAEKMRKVVLNSQGVKGKTPLR